MHRARRLWTARLPEPLLRHISARIDEPVGVRRRRQRVATVTAAAGSLMLGSSLRTEPGSPAFYRETLAVAGIWTIGSLASGPLHLGRVPFRDGTERRPLVLPILTGVAAFGAFDLAARVAGHIPVLGTAVSDVLRYAEEGRMSLVVLTTGANAIAEEVFFRGALYTAVGGHRAPVLVSTAAYTAATAASRNPALAVAGAVMGVLFGLQRRATGGVQTSLLTHLTWSMLMLKFLPPRFRRHRNPDAR